jgi:hypothetical protein
MKKIFLILTKEFFIILFLKEGDKNLDKRVNLNISQNLGVSNFKLEVRMISLILTQNLESIFMFYS